MTHQTLHKMSGAATRHPLLHLSLFITHCAQF